MAARKLQTEIDKTLKKVAEGVEQFEDLYKKIQQSTNLAHKEKQEAELKTQIKKLQRLRDQIKTWLASNEIKDKKALTDNRKLIETQMERFKACEKEMKTKAFSKEGLSAGTKLDPKEQLKIETAAFVTSMVEELGRQVEQTEAEIEQLQGGAKKSKKGAAGSAEKVANLEELNERRQWHVSRLELILRLMENGNMDPDRVVALKEDISYFVESNTEEEFEEDEGIYEELNLEEEEEAFGMAERDELQSSHDSMSAADPSDIAPFPAPRSTPAKARAPSLNTTLSGTVVSGQEESGAERSPTASKTAAPAMSKRKPTLDGTAQRPTGLAAPSRSVSGSTPASSIPTTSSTSISTSGATAAPPTTPGAPAPRTVPAVLPPIRYSAAAAAAVSNANAASSSQQQQPTTPLASTASIAPPTSQQFQPVKESIASPSAAPAATSSSTPLTSAPAQVLSPAPIEPSPAPSTGSAPPTPQKGQEQPAKSQPSVQAPSASPSPAISHASVPQNAAAPTPSPGLTPVPAADSAAALLSPSQQAASVAPLQALEIGSQPQQQGSQVSSSSGTIGSSASGALAQSPFGGSGAAPGSSAGTGIPMASPNSAYMPPPPNQQAHDRHATGLSAVAVGATSPGAIGAPGQGQGQGQNEARLPSSLADLVTSFENAKQKSLKRDNDLGAVHEILDAGYPNIPQPADAEKPKYYIPRNPYPTPHYYPQQPSPHLANPALFAKFDIDTLFYIFYYCQGTYMQYLAAQELKKQSWRFHKQYLTWFQRANEPQAITDEYEQGVYLYFDFEGSWAQRRKENFSFYYRHLEE